MTSAANANSAATLDFITGEYTEPVKVRKRKVRKTLANSKSRTSEKGSTKPWWKESDVIVYKNDERIPTHCCLLNPEYIPEEDSFGYVFRDADYHKFFNRFIEDTLALARDCKPGTKQYVEVMEFINSENFLLYCDAVGLHGHELRRGVYAIKEGINFSDCRDVMNPAEAHIHHLHAEQEADERCARLL